MTDIWASQNRLGYRLFCTVHLDLPGRAGERSWQTANTSSEKVGGSQYWNPTSVTYFARLKVQGKEINRGLSRSTSPKPGGNGSICARRGSEPRRAMTPFRARVPRILLSTNIGHGEGRGCPNLVRDTTLYCGPSASAKSVRDRRHRGGEEIYRGHRLPTRL